MKKILTFFLMVISAQLFAQNYPITSINISLPASPDANTANWGSGASVITITASAKPGADILKMLGDSKILVTIKKGGAKVCGDFTSSTAPSAGFNTMTKAWAGANAASLIGKGCILAPGDYELCVQFFGASPKIGALSEEKCRPFTIRGNEQQTYQPPQAISPADGSVIGEKDAKNPVTFRWTPVVPKPKDDVLYKVKVIEIRQGQSATAAMKSASPIIEKEVVNQNQLAGILLSQYPIAKESKYGWYVQATNKEGKPFGGNDGMSELYSFSLWKTDVASLIGIELISPKDSITDAKPTFKWIPKKPFPEDVTYRLKVVPLNENQKPEDAIKSNKSFIEVSNIKETLLKYPRDAAKLDSSQNYVWSVEAIDKGSTILGKSILILHWPCSCFMMWPGPQSLYIKCQTDPVFNIPSPGGLWGNCLLPRYGWQLNGGLYNMSPSNSSYTVNPGTLPNLFPQSNTITWYAKEGNVIKCTRTFTVWVFPSLHAEIHDWLPGISGPEITEICITGADATLYVPNLPAGNLNWTWSDAPGVQTGTLGTSNPMNTGPIQPNCSGGIPYIIRTYTAHITGSTTPPWPVNCPVASVALKVWCPTVGGTIAVTTSTHTMQPGNKICSAPNGYPVNLSLTLSGNVGNVISWTRYPGTIPLYPGLTTISDVITTAGVYNYTVQVQNGPLSGGCPSAPAQVTVTVEDPLTATITSIIPVGTSPLWVCPNDAVQLQLNTQLSGTLIQWQYQINCTGPWVNAGTAINQNTNSIGNQGPYVPVPTQSLCWRATVSSAAAICPAVTSAPFTILLYPAPCPLTISLLSVSLPKCPGNPVTLQASTPTCGNPPFTYQWYLGGVILAGATSQQITVTAPGFYTVETWAAGHCISALSPPFKVTNCVMNPIIMGPCVTNGTTTVTLSVNPYSSANPAPQNPPCNGPYTYTWTTGSNVISTTQSISVTPTSTTTYCVEVIDGLGCHKTVCTTIKVCP